jgi:alpha-galactosidase
MGAAQRRRLAGQAMCAAVAAVVLGVACTQRTSVPQEQSSKRTSIVQVQAAAGALYMGTPTAQFVLSPNGFLQANLVREGKRLTLDEASGPALTVQVNGRDLENFDFDLAHAKVSEATGKLGKLGKKIEVSADNRKEQLTATLSIEMYDDFPSVALVALILRNSGTRELRLNRVLLVERRLNATLAESTAAPFDMWSFHGASIKWGQDDVIHISKRFSQQNPFGLPVETPGDLGRVGGGIPVVAFWTGQVGEAIGHVETLPLALSMPVETRPDGRVRATVKVAPESVLKPGEVYSSPRTFLAVYSGDYYEPLSVWSEIVDREGLARPANNPENYAISWCGWGYESDVTPKQMVDTIPKLKELGIHWATLDDRWFNNYGDWQPRPDTFPGDAIRTMVKSFHDQGIKVQIWWLPLAAENGKGRYEKHNYVLSDVVKQHPDWLILDEKGHPALMTRNLPALCPAVPEVQAYYKKLTERFIRDWDFDGHKLDNIYTVPACYNPKHHHQSPMDSVNAMGDVYKIIFETTRSLKADSVTQSCPCGTPPSLAWFRYMDQAVTADPVGSEQVRRRIKMYKALLGPHAAVYGDHVELTRINFQPHSEQDLGRDFASTLGTGGVLGTKFTWPDYGPKFKNVLLTPEKDAHWKKWIRLYNDKMLSQGTFRNLYVMGYDHPEGYAIEKDGKMYYAFYAAAGDSRGPPAEPRWSGTLELRGLGSGPYRVTDYVNGRDFGVVSGPTGKIQADFTESLLLEAVPVAAPRP